jgi:hypothetical protein
MTRHTGGQLQYVAFEVSPADHNTWPTRSPRSVVCSARKWRASCILAGVCTLSRNLNSGWVRSPRGQNTRSGWSAARGLAALLSGLVVLSVAASEARASSVDGSEPSQYSLGRRLELGGFAGVLLPPHSRSLGYWRDESDQFASVFPSLGLRLGLFPLAWFGLEGELAAMPGATRSGRSVLLYSPRASLVAALPSDGLTPFVLAGYGNLGLRSNAVGGDLDLSVHFGAGVGVTLPANLRLRIELREALTPASHLEPVSHWLEALLGITWVWGPAPLPPLPPRSVVMDSDADGVADADDLCSSTPANTVDGCTRTGPVRN